MGKRTNTTFNQPAVFMLIADGTIDQIVETAAIAKHEKRDLEDMSCEVRVLVFHGETLQKAWKRAEDYQARKEG